MTNQIGPSLPPLSKGQNQEQLGVQGASRRSSVGSSGDSVKNAIERHGDKEPAASLIDRKVTKAPEGLLSNIRSMIYRNKDEKLPDDHMLKNLGFNKIQQVVKDEEGHIRRVIFSLKSNNIDKQKGLSIDVAFEGEEIKKMGDLANKMAIQSQIKSDKKSSEKDLERMDDLVGKAKVDLQKMIFPIQKIVDHAYFEIIEGTAEGEPFFVSMPTLRNSSTFFKITKEGTEEEEEPYYRFEEVSFEKIPKDADRVIVD